VNSRSRTTLATIVVGATALVVLVGCASGSVGDSGPSGSGSNGSGSSSSGSGSSASIRGTWKLTSGTDSTGAISPGTANVTLKVNGGSSGGHGPCNSFGADVTGTTTGAITIVVGIHTDMACVDPDLNTTETRYFAALDAVSKAALTSETLTLSGGGDTLVFSRVSA
jgi:heat shock protein HslJ